MKRIATILIMWFSLLMVSGQESRVIYPFQPFGYNPFHPHIGTRYNAQASGIPETKKLDVDVELGTSFSTDFNKGFSLTTYAAPELKYRLNKRFTVRGGISLANSEYGNTLVYSPYGFSRFNGNVTQGMIYVSGDYVLGPRLILSGTAYKEFSVDHSGTDNILGPGYDGKGLMMNLRFMPSDNVTIDAGVEFYEGNNPYRRGYHNPFYTPFYPQW